jgi:hypothetical protein
MTKLIVVFDILFRDPSDKTLRREYIGPAVSVLVFEENRKKSIYPRSVEKHYQCDKTHLIV